MTQIFDIILIGIIGYAIYLAANKKKIKTRVGSVGSLMNVKPDTTQDIINDVLSIDSLASRDTQSSEHFVLKKEYINPNFIDVQFHNDYRDVITAINNIIPSRKQLFNLANIPLRYTEPPKSEVYNIVTDFVSVLNVNLKTEVPVTRSKNTGWDEAVVDPNVKSGWDKVQESLGLPVSLYEDPAKNSAIHLVSIKHVQMYETDDEIKYSIEIILQKQNVDDQMIIKVSFVQDKRPLVDENNFFVSKNIKLKIVIEDLFILGYLSKGGNNAIREFDGDKTKFFEYENMERNDLVDPKYIQKVLMEKYAERTNEMEGRNAMLDQEGQNFHKTLPHMYDFSNIRGTRTIFDDMNKTKTFI